MRGRQHTLLVLLGVGVASVLYFTTAASGHTGRSGDSNAEMAAAGSFTATVAGLTDQRRFAFDVIRRGSSVLGEEQVHNPVLGADATISLDCLIVRGNQGIAGGTVTQTSDPSKFAIGWRVAFAFQDDPDRISFNSTDEDTPPAITCDNLLSQNGVTSITDFLNFAGVPNQQAVVTIGVPGS